MRGGLELRASHGKSALLCLTALLFLVVVSVRADIHPVPLSTAADGAGEEMIGLRFHNAHAIYRFCLVRVLCIRRCDLSTVARY
jgi:hypothetical protein